ncbi:MAG: arginine--tRNA ligase domain-containing protein, partial [Thermoplasmataceae archaeon]
KKLDFVLYAFVSLETGSMSTRKGNAVTVKELVEKTYERALEVIKEKRGESTISNEIAKKIAVSAIRFNILKVNSSKAMVFKWKDALDFNGDSAPFVMYSYVRALNILNKSAIRYELEPGEAVAKNLKKEESSLILNLYQYPFVIAESVKNLKPEMLANFAFMLSKTFNDFYENCKVNSEEYEISVRRLMIVNIYKNIIEDVSSIIGIQLVPEM